jgi:hypothetical protein
MVLKFVLFFFSGEKKVEDITAITTIEANLFPDHNQNEYFLLLFMSTFFCQIMNVLVLMKAEIRGFVESLNFYNFSVSQFFVLANSTILVTIFLSSKTIE